ncbi:hypothetical protein [Actinomadura soli]|nr:hypothetical protein [Actinomadura soli]
MVVLTGTGQRGTAWIPSQEQRSDSRGYKDRNVVERCTSKLKQF